MNKNLISLVLASTSLLITAGCTGNNKEKTMVEVEIPALRSGINTSSAPSTVADFDCVVLNVTGSGISQEQGLGLVSTMVAATTGGTLKVEVPVGSSRLFQIVGVTSSSGSCPTEITRAGLFSTSAYPVLSEVGRTVADINGDTTLKIRGSYNSSTAVDVRTGQSLGGDSGGGGGGGGGGSTPPTSHCADPTLGSQFAGGGGTSTSDPYLIATVAQWNLIGTELNLRHCHFKLTNNLDFQGTTPNQIRALDATIDGNNKTLSNGVLPYLSEGGYKLVGLINNIGSYGQVKNLTIDGFSFPGSSGASEALRGGFVVSFIQSAFSTNTALLNVTVKNSTVTHSLEWNPPSVLIHKLGALVGDMTRMAIVDCRVENVTLTTWPAVAAGGLVGKVTEGTLSNNRVSNLHIVRTNSTAGIYAYGGLVGLMESGIIEDSLVQSSDITDATANKPNLSYGIGGAVGVLQGTMRRVGVISTTITAGSNLGGLVGAMLTNGYVEDSFAQATVDVSGTTGGGAIGYLNTTAAGTRVTRVHSVSVVTGDDATGFVGAANVTNRIQNSYWQNEVSHGGAVSGDATSTTLLGLDSSQMQDTANFVDWDFSASGPWMMDSYPLLNSLGPW